MSCPFYYAQIVSVFPAAASSVITFTSPFKHLLFRLNNLVPPICAARSAFLDFTFSLLSKEATSFLEIRNLTQEKVLQPGSAAVLREGLLPTSHG